MNRKILIAVSLLCWLTWFPLSTYSSEGQHKIVKDEYEIKAGFLARFADYIEWPGGMNIYDTSKPFVIGIIGQSPISTHLENRRPYKRIRGRKMNIKHFLSPEEIKDCHILFIAKSAKKDLPQILSITKNKPILTVGDTEGFARRGVHINIYRQGNKLRYEVNETTIRSSQFDINYHLLRYARILNPLRRRNEGH